MFAAEKFAELDNIVVALAHLFAIDGDHIIMQPIFRWHMTVTNGALGNFTFVMRELQVHAASMYIKFFSQVFCAHGGAFYVPARKPFTPGALPAHDVFRRGSFP